MSKLNWKKIIKNDTVAASVLGGGLLSLAQFIMSPDTVYTEYAAPFILGLIITSFAIEGAKWMKKW